MGKKNVLFDEDEEAAPAQLKVNEDFAKRFEHNKKREEIHRLKEKYPEVAARLEAKMLRGGGDESNAETSSDEEDDGYISTKKEAQILETILKIRRKEPAIYDKDAKFYSSDEEDGEEEDEEDENEGGEEGAAADKKASKEKKQKKEKPMFLKDVMYKEAMDRAAGDISDTDSEDDRRRSDSDEPKVKTYTQEQAELKNAFLSAFNNEAEEVEDEGDAFGGVLKTRRKASSKNGAAAAAASVSDASEDEDGDASGSGKRQGGKEEIDEARVQELLDSYFGSGRGGERTMKEEDRFLRNYILHRGWVEGDGDGDEDGGEGDGGEGDGGDPADDFEDLAALAAADAFEAQYNFRFEEPGGAQLITHPRQMEGTVRKEDDRRKRHRAEKAARKAAEEEERRAEIRRLKNLKKGQIEDKLAEVEKVAGAHAPSQALLDELLDGDFDPEAHDMAMAAAFGDDYYGCDEEDIADAQFEAELQAMAEYPTDDEAAEGTFDAVHERLANKDKDGGVGGFADFDQNQEGEEGMEEEEEGVGEDAEGAAAAKADVKRLLEEYHRLDYEDHVGGIPTRFRYKEVAKETYGLTLEEILTMDDKELNQIMGLKSVAAPYRQGQRTQRPNYGKLNELRKERGWGEGGPGGRGSSGSFGGRGGGGGGDGRRYDNNRSYEPRKDAKPVATAAEKRLATFDAPKLKKKRPAGSDGGGDAYNNSGSIQRKKPKQTEHAQQQQVAQQQAVESGLSKAQRKNIKRAAKRASKRSDVASGGAS